ncbi:MAG TPA: 16S rRNA (adenine(1518)-N(6)/adenine(1519)-N(6))-dimethyltransferase RsmA [Polyangiaceae bacterium]
MSTGSDESAAEVLARHGLRPKRHFGQNFLLDRRLAERIAGEAAPEGALVVEIGAGLGALTRPLLSRARTVVAIERDRDLVPVLRAELESEVASGRLVVVEADAKRFDYEATLGAVTAPRAIAGNLPYNLTGPLLERITGLAGCLERATVLVQLEVADRLAAPPGTPAYGALGVFVQAAFRVRRAFVVRRGAFHPAPEVDSAVVVLEPLAEPLAVETEAFRSLVKAAFGQRRKTLKNAWRALASSDALEAAARSAGIDLGARGETLGVAAFARMALEISEK